MTAEAPHTRAVIYALGGGRGHAQRAACLATRFDRATIFHQSQGQPPRSPHAEWVRVDPTWNADALRAAIVGCTGWATTLVVDTFPRGIGGELDSSVLDRFAHTVVVCRYVRPGRYADYEHALSAFDERWIPYEVDADEWDGECSGTHVGTLTRSIGVAANARTDVVVIGDARRLPASWRAALPPGTQWLSGPFDTVPAARKYISIGAGHNITYELTSLGTTPGLIALERRYDDQFRRAERSGVGLHSTAAVRSFVEA